PMRLMPSKLISFLPAKFYYGATRRWLGWLGERALQRADYDLVTAWSQSARTLFTRAAQRGIPRLLHSGNLHVAGKGSPLLPQRWPAIDGTFMLAEFDLSSLIMVPSGFCRESFLLQGVAPDRVVSVERGADQSRYFPAAERPPGFRVICCGQVCERTGVEQLVEAWRRAALPEAELWFVGAVDHEVAAFVAGVRDPSIHFCGFQKNPGDFIRQGHVQILLSRNEGLAKTLIEGAACGLATVATPASGFPIEEGVTGCFVNRDQPDQVAAVLRRLHAEPALVARLGRAGREFAARHFIWERFHRDFVSVVDGLLAQAPRP
ncbi:MAG: glycosyltransferase family 4 protein, partial [Limisphaerales bacterium]